MSVLNQKIANNPYFQRFFKILVFYILLKSMAYIKLIGGIKKKRKKS